MSWIDLPYISSGGGGGGGAYVQVNAYADLPDPATVSGEIYVVLTTTGVWPFRKLSGFYYSTGSAWTYLGELSPSYIAQAYESNPNTNKFTDAYKAQLDALPTDLNAKSDVLNDTGSGESIIASSSTAQVKKLIAGSNVTLTPGADGITISSSGSGGSVAWGGITGTLSDQTDLQAALDGKIDESVLTAKGNILTATAANTPAILPVGTNGYMLSADSAETTGLKWVPASGASYTFADSLVNTSGTVTLVNDSNTPGNSTYYGTDGTGTKGFFSLPSGSGNIFNDTNSINLTDTSGTVTADLKLSGGMAGAGEILVNLSIETDGLKGVVSNSDIVSAIPNASSSTTGLLTSTDWNTFNNKQPALGFTPENVANKSTSLASPDNTKYPTTLAVSTAISGLQPAGNYITALSGDVVATGPGSAAASIQPGVITNSMVNASAAIALTKLAATTASRALVSDGSGFIVPATTTATEIGYVNGVTSSIQTQLNAKMTNPMTTGGDIIYGGASGTPSRLANGTAGQVLTSSGGTSAPTWTTVSSGAAGISFNVTSTAHGLSVLTPMYWDSTAWVIAKSDALGTLATHVIVAVPNANTFTLASEGRFSSVNTTGKTAGVYYYTSDTTAGTVTSSIPSYPNYSNPLFQVETVGASGVINVFCFRANQVGGIVNADISPVAAIAQSKLALSITNSEINASAGIAYSKLNLSGSIVNADVSTGAAIAHSKMASLTASRAMVTDGSGVATVSTVTSTELGYVSGVTGAIQTQIDGKLTNPMTTNGDLITRAAGVASRLGVGSNNQVLTVVSGAPAWASIPGPTDQTLPALDIDFNYNTSFKSISTNSTFTFSNTANGKSISIGIYNSSGADVTITLPTVVKRTDFTLVVKAGKKNVYTFVCTNSEVYAAVVSEMA